LAGRVDHVLDLLWDEFALVVLVLAEFHDFHLADVEGILDRGLVRDVVAAVYRPYMHVQVLVNPMLVAPQND